MAFFMPLKDEYLEVARRNARFLLENLYQDGRLLRSWRDGQDGGRAQHNGYLEDYASLILGLLALYQSDPDPVWYTEALKLADEMVSHFSDESVGFFDTRDDHETLLFRPKDIQDNATPSGNSLAASVLIQLSAYGDRPEWRKLAEQMLAANQDMIARFPSAFSQWLCAVDWVVGPHGEVAIIGDLAEPQTKIFTGTLWSKYRPRLVTAVSPDPAWEGSPGLVKDRPKIGEMTTAYVCQGFVCKQPVNSPQELVVQLEEL